MRSWLSAGVCALAAAALFVHAGDTAADSRDAAPPPGLTPAGRVLWNFEGLLHRSFPGRKVVSAKVDRSRRYDFTCPGFCGPLSVYSPYWFVFAPHRDSAFHVSSRKFHSGYFGNYPLLVLIRGRTIACDSEEHRFLLEYADSVAFTLGCLRA